jgi:hypothetical protein
MFNIFAQNLLYIAFVLLVVCILPYNLYSQPNPQHICEVRQINQEFTGIIGNIDISPNGNRVFYQSTENNLGLNPDGNSEIFMYDIPSDTLTQRTVTPFSQSALPSTNSDGSVVAFQSGNDLDPLSNNIDGTLEIFYHNVDLSTFTQITNTSGSDIATANLRPIITPDASRSVFTSGKDLVFGSNTDANREIFFFDSGVGFTQVTDTTGGTLGTSNNAGAISDDGSRVIFRSGLDITGGNPEGSVEFFLFDEVTGFDQITDTQVETSKATISGDGETIVIVTKDDLTGNNPDNSREIFVKNIGSSTITQITDTPNPTDRSFGVSINTDGTRLAFYSEFDHTGTGKNADGSHELFVYDFSLGKFAQITDSSVPLLPPGPNATDISADGNTIFFETSADLTGDNPGGEQVLFVALCASDLDLDGINNEDDECENSNTDPTVVIDGCSSGVQNFVSEDGCSILDLIDQIAANASNHGKLVSEVAKLLNSLKKEGVISGNDKGAIQTCAASSDLP